MNTPTRESLWRTMDGRVLAVKDMEDSHILNIIRCIRGMSPEGTKVNCGGPTRRREWLNMLANEVVVVVGAPADRAGPGAHSSPARVDGMRLVYLTVGIWVVIVGSFACAIAIVRAIRRRAHVSDLSVMNDRWRKDHSYPKDGDRRW
jgi:hypothetical protein